MRHVNGAAWKGVRKALSDLAARSNTLFDRAPVMLHMIDGDGKLLNVNRRWTQRLGYEREEVIGHRSIEFLTEESRARAVEDTLPLFWRAGSARSVGYRFVRKDGRVLDALLDAELITLPGGNHFTYAAIRDVEDVKQWEQASATIKALQELTHVRSGLESVLSALESDKESPGSSEGRSPGQLLETGLAEKALGSLLEVAEDISTNLRVLRVLPEVHEEWLSALVQQQQELLLVAKSIDSTLADLADRIMTTPPESG